jgi:hypothetical protein
LQPMGPDQLAGIADLIHHELPSGKWNAAVRASKVVGFLARICSAILCADVAVTRRGAQRTIGEAKPASCSAAPRLTSRVPTSFKGSARQLPEAAP